MCKMVTDPHVFTLCLGPYTDCHTGWATVHCCRLYHNLCTWGLNCWGSGVWLAFIPYRLILLLHKHTRATQTPQFGYILTCKLQCTNNTVCKSMTNLKKNYCVPKCCATDFIIKVTSYVYFYLHVLFHFKDNARKPIAFYLGTDSSIDTDK